jgi:hypothetical protein
VAPAGSALIHPWSDAIPSCRVIDHRADSRCVVRSLPNPEPRNAKTRHKGGPLNIRPRAGETGDVAISSLPQLRPVPQEPISCHRDACARA